ncbi:MAG TPA: MFS transporter [Burkholderiales bacterium]|nr:MFS transporter [Burkholderiales bacterium]
MSYRLAAFYFAFFVWAGLMVAYFPAYLAARGLGAAQIAWVLALPQLARIVAPAAWGWIADRTGAQRAIVVFACLANVACFALLPQVPGFVAILWLIGVASVLSAAALPLVEAITLGALAGQAGRYGPIRMWGSIGFIAAVLAGGAWLDFQSVLTLPHGLLAFALATVAVALALPNRTAPAARGSIRVPLDPKMAALLGAGFCMAAAHGTFHTFYTLHLQRAGYSGWLIGFLWTLGVLAEIGIFLWLPAIFRRYALSQILMASAGLGVVRFLLIGWGVDSLALLLAAQLMHGITFGAFHAAAIAGVHRVFPPHAQARGQTLFSSVAYGAGGAAGALAAGWAWDASGPGVAFSLSSIAAMAGLLFAYSLKRAGL